MATIRDKLGHCCFEAGTAFRGIQLRSRSDMPGVIQSRDAEFADGRQTRTDFAFGASVATSDRVSGWLENSGRLTVSEGREVPLRGASSSHYQREGDLLHRRGGGEPGVNGP